MEIVPLSSLWLPILLSAALVFVVSAIVWTVMPHHKTDWTKLPDEDDILKGFRHHTLEPGHYTFPFTQDMGEFKSPEFQKKLDDGPVGLLTVVTADSRRNMGKPLVLSFVYYAVVSVLVAYIAGRTLSAGAPYLSVFRITGTVATVAYSAALFQDAIWFGRNWGSTWKSVIDSVVYGLLTAGVFGWLWPEA